MRCLEENTLFGFVRGALDTASRQAVVQHADGCDSCRRLIAAAADAFIETQAESPPRAAALSPPTNNLLAGKYRIVRQLGAGGMGVVHEAVNTWTGRRVAIKLLHASFSDDSNATQRFMQEARSASQIAHPNVVDILDLGQDPETGALFIVQEFLTGSTLRQRLAERGRLGIEEAIDLLEPVIGALVVAHESGVVHRDIKPENIFLAIDALGRQETKLIDFGLSKLVREEDRLAISEHGRQIGTPYYMSPEQLRVEPIDGRTDVWAMGVVLFELIGGVRPFRGPTYSELIVQIMKEPLPRLEALAPQVPSSFSAIVERALERNREQRLTARELGEALRTYRRSMTAPLQSPTRVTNSRRYRRRMVASAVLCAGVGIGVLGTIRIKAPPPAPTTASSPTVPKQSDPVVASPPHVMAPTPAWTPPVASSATAPRSTPTRKPRSRVAVEPAQSPPPAVPSPEVSSPPRAPQILLLDP